MKPLQQWICDKCGQVILRPRDGWFEWLEELGGDNRRAYGFKIVHHATSSPDGLRCYHYDKHSGRADLHLHDVIGENLPKLYRFLDIGPYHDPEGHFLLNVRDLREFVEVLRRLTLPYYEEARLYFDVAREDGFFDGANEVWIYLPETLRSISQTYGNESNSPIAA